VTRRTATRVLFALAIAGATIASVLAVMGGFTIRVAGVRLSAHGVIRPLLFSLLTYAIALRRLSPQERAELVERSSRVGAKLAPWCAAAVAIVVLVVAVECSTRSAGGSDTYGYVSQARLWLRGDLHVRQDFAAAAPWPDAEWTFSPLGYRPAAGHTIVPTYAPGLPLLMAGFRAMGGACGPFVVTPLCAAVGILLAYAVGARLSGPATGLVAALLRATSPTFIFMSLWSMSDVPATTLWTAALVLAWRPRGRTRAALAGIAAGAAITVRPNLAPLIVFPCALLVVSTAEDRIRRAITYLAGSVPFATFVALLNQRLYGSALASGYGDTVSLFSVDYAGVNAIQFSSWLWDTQGPLVFLFVVAPLVRWVQRRADNGAGWSATSPLVLLGFVAGVFACYLLYTPFHAWWFLRFVLPAFPAIFALASDAVWVGSARFGPAARAAVMLVFTLVSVDWSVRFTKAQGVLDLGNGEQKYADVGRFIARELPPNAVVIAVLHSGSVRYYSDRQTLRYDWLDAEWLDRAVQYLKRSGQEPYVLLESSELEEFREKFKTQKTVATLAPIARHPRGIFLYAVTTTGGRADALIQIPRTSGCE